MENDVFVLLLGANAGAYALGASFAEYGIPVTLMDEAIPSTLSASKFICDVRSVPGIGYRGLLLRALSDFYEAHAGKSILLLPTTGAYTERVLAEREVLERMFLLPNKKWQKGEPLSPAPDALLLAYVGRTGALRTVYGEVAASNAYGEPLALITKATPPSLLAEIPCDTPHFALYAVKNAALGTAVTDEDALSPLVAFASAADLSLAEWMLTDYISCEPIGADGETPSGLFTLFSYGKTKKHLSPSRAEQAKALRRRHLFISLFAGRNETKHPCRRLVLKRFYGELWQKKTKKKK